MDTLNTSVKFIPDKNGIFKQNPTIEKQNLKLREDKLTNDIVTRRNTDFYKYSNVVSTPFMKFNNLNDIVKK